MAEKYRNGRLVIRKRGRYAKAPSLAELGYDINGDASLKTCAGCGQQSRPVLNTGWVCRCGHRN